jgi:hypothetical protein
LCKRMVSKIEFYVLRKTYWKGTKWKHYLLLRYSL